MTTDPAETAPRLARQLGIDDKRLRRWLRREYPRGPVHHGRPWVLDAEAVAAARQHFG